MEGLYDQSLQQFEERNLLQRWHAISFCLYNLHNNQADGRTNRERERERQTDGGRDGWMDGSIDR